MVFLCYMFFKINMLCLEVMIVFFKKLNRILKNELKVNILMNLRFYGLNVYCYVYMNFLFGI